MRSSLSSRRVSCAAALALGVAWAAPALAEEPTPEPVKAPTEKAEPEKAAVERAEPERESPRRKAAEAPTPLQVDYAQYGVAFAGEILLEPGATCPIEASAPCILGPGGGPVLRGGYRPAGPFYIGGAYEFAKLDSNNLYRLGILQELRAEMRYYVDVGSRFTPFATWALGGMVYGNEFGVETGGVTTNVGVGVEFEVTRFAVLQLNVVYQPMLFIAFEDTAGQQRNTGVAHFIHFEFGIELKTELGRE